MKKIFSILLVLILITGSCIKNKFAEPDKRSCELDFEPNTSIAELKSMLSGDAPMLIDTEVIIKGTVVANDKSGNLYKSFIIQDSTESGVQSALMVSINEYETHNKYHLGDMIYIKCEDLYIGKYGGLIQLGTLHDGGIGRIGEPSVKYHIFNACNGKLIKPKTVTLTELASVPKNTLIKLENVQFLRRELGEKFADGINHITTDQIISDCDNTAEIIVRTSGYSKFANEFLPEGMGSLIAINGSYNDETQLLLRFSTEVKFDNSRCGYYPVFEEYFEGSLGNFNQYNVSGSETWEYSSQYGAVMNGNHSSNEDWMISNAVDLTNYSSVVFSFRHALNYITPNGYNDTEVYICSDYDGTSNPNTSGTWVKLNGINYPPGDDWGWVSSGYIDVSSYSGNSNVYFAFKYTSNSNSCTWEIDDFLISVPE